jgi:hypothetical protein
MGERKVSVSRLVCTLTLVQWSQMGSLLYAIFGPPLQSGDRHALHRQFKPDST